MFIRMVRRITMTGISPILVLVLAAMVWLTACAHIVHPAHVEPGFHIEVAAASVRQETGYVRETEAVMDAQIALGYGKRFDDDTALGLQLVVPISSSDPSEDNLAGVLGSLLDIYIQVLGDPVDLGFGVALGFGPEVYAEIGHGVERDGYKYGVNLGTRAGLTTQISPFVLVDILTPGGLRLGLFGEYTHYIDYWATCDGCPVLRSRQVLGAFVGIRL
jgi:hypothetical protein